MKKIIILIFLISQLYPIYSEEFLIEKKFKNDEIKNGGIPYRNGFAGMPSVPNNIYLNIKENIIFFEDVISKNIYKYKMSKKQIGIIPLSENNTLSDAALWNHIVIPIRDKYYLCIASDIFKIHRNHSEVIYKDSGDVNRKYERNIHPIGSHIFFYDEDGFVRCVDLEGNKLSREESLKVLLEYNENLDEEEKAGMTSKHRDMLESGEHIILGDRYYNSSISEMLSYYERLFGKNNENYVKYPKGCQFLGFDDEHNGYWISNNSNTEKFLKIFNKRGKLLLNYNYAEDITLYDKYNRINFYLARESGNIYAMQTDANEGTIIYKMNHSWGEPNMFAIARNGIGANEKYEKYVTEILTSYSKSELNLLKNHLYAIYGYQFKNEKILEYFKKQAWYETDTSVTKNTEYFTENQKNLFDKIKEIEAEK